MALAARNWVEAPGPLATPCHKWTGSLGPGGYGRIHYGGRNTGAHRFRYHTEVAPVPRELVIDHLCRVPGCTNPEHLEPVTCGENIRRGLTGHAHRERALAQTHCKRGHPFDAENTQFSRRGHRRCRTCIRANRPHAKARLASFKEVTGWGA